MHIARRLARGTAGWLSFEYYCRRGQLFEEKYLTVPVGQILFSEYGNRVASEVDHPLLKEHIVGPGKRPKIDFAVTEGESLKVAVEAKWAGATPLKVEAIIWDLIRLELLAHHFKCTSLFVLAGARHRIRALFESDAFLAPNAQRKPRPILKDGVHRSLGMRLDRPPEQRAPIVKRLVSKYPDIKMPSKISSGFPFVFPAECNGSDFQVYVWEILPARPRKTFSGRTHKLYRPEPLKNDVQGTKTAG